MSFTKTRVSHVLESKRTPREITIGPAAPGMRGRKRASDRSVADRREAARQARCRQLAVDLQNIRRDIDQKFEEVEIRRQRMSALAEVAARSASDSRDQAVQEAIIGTLGLIPAVRAARGALEVFRRLGELANGVAAIERAASKAQEANTTLRQASHASRLLADDIQNLHATIDLLRRRGEGIERMRKRLRCDPLRRQF